MNNSLLPPLKLLIFDWGNTLMRDFDELEGPMYYWDHVEVIDGVEDFLNLCYDKYPLAVATNAGYSDTALMIKALNRGGIDKCFSYFYSSKDLGVAKPDPQFFLSIACEIKIEPSSIAVFGNDYRKDIEPAKKAGMITFFFNENNIPGNYPDADFVFCRFDELFGLFM